jgi:hypothetical protein
MYRSFISEDNDYTQRHYICVSTSSKESVSVHYICPFSRCDMASADPQASAHPKDRPLLVKGEHAAPTVCCLQEWADHFARDEWPAACTVGMQLLDDVPGNATGREASFGMFVVQSIRKFLKMRDGHRTEAANAKQSIDIQVFDEVPVQVCADGRPAKTFGRADIACVGSDGTTVIIELKIHYMIATGPSDAALRERLNETSDYYEAGRLKLSRCTLDQLVVLRDHIRHASPSKLWVMHSVFGGDSFPVIHRVGRRVFALRTAQEVMDSALQQAETYAASVRTDGFHPKFEPPHAVSSVKTLAVVAVSDRILAQWGH